MRGYQPRPVYPPVGGSVAEGWDAAVAQPAGRFRSSSRSTAPRWWTGRRSSRRLGAALRAAGPEVATCDTHDWLLPWPEIEARTASPLLADDPDFATLTEAEMADLVSIPALERPAVRRAPGPRPGRGARGRTTSCGSPTCPSGSPRPRSTRAGGRNLGMPAGEGRATTRRLFYIDWPIQDRHRDAVAPRVDRWIDAQDPVNPGSLDGDDAARDAATAWSCRPFRVRPTFTHRELGRPLGPARARDEPRTPGTPASATS